MFYGTKEVATLLGIPVANLQQAIFRGKVSAPRRGPGRAFLWAPEDIEKASWALRRRGWDAYTPAPKSRRPERVTSLAVLEVA